MEVEHVPWLKRVSLRACLPLRISSHLEKKTGGSDAILLVGLASSSTADGEEIIVIKEYHR